MPPKDKDKTPDPEVKAADVSALSGVPAAAPAAAKPPKPFLSEGMRTDLENVGYAIDPVSGARFEVNRETGEVTVTERGAPDAVTSEATAGKVSTVDVEVTPPATRIDPETGETLVTDPETGVTTATNPVTGDTRIVENPAD